MKKLVLMPSQTTLWKCQDCDLTVTTTEKIRPWILSCISELFGPGKSPICPKCKRKMIKMKLYY